MAWTSFSVSNVCEALKTQKNPRHAPCPQKSNRTPVDLIRASINLRQKFFRRRWITGSSPVMTISLGMTEVDGFERTAFVPTPSCLSDRQKAPDRRHEENPEIDCKADVPKDGAQRRPVAEIGEDIGNPHDQEQHRKLIDEILRAGAKFRQQHGGSKERKGFDPVDVRA